ERPRPEARGGHHRAAGRDPPSLGPRGGRAQARRPGPQPDRDPLGGVTKHARSLESTAPRGLAPQVRRGSCVPRPGQPGRPRGRGHPGGRARGDQGGSHPTKADHRYVAGPCATPPCRGGEGPAPRTRFPQGNPLVPPAPKVPMDPSDPRPARAPRRFEDDQEDPSLRLSRVLPAGQGRNVPQPRPPRPEPEARRPPPGGRMSTGPRFRVHFRRRREGRTDYRVRLKLLKSGRLRAVVRLSERRVRVSLVEYDPTGDRVLATADSVELGGVEFPAGSLASTPA